LDLLIKGAAYDEGNVDMAVRRKQRDQRKQTAQDQGDPALDIEQPNPTHAQPSLLSQQHTCTGRHDLGRGPVSTKPLKRL
jgi:hypothetical protein